MYETMDRHPEFWRAFIHVIPLADVKCLKSKGFAGKVNLGTGFDCIGSQDGFVFSIFQVDFSQTLGGYGESNKIL
jgi:hypothetical protein